LHFIDFSFLSELIDNTMATTSTPTSSSSQTPPNKSVLANAPSRKPVKKKPLPWTMIIIAVLVAGGLAYWYWSSRQSASNQSTTITTKVSTGNITETVSATGSVTAQTGAEVAIGSQVTGVVQRLYADVGTQLKAGQLIARLGIPDVQDQLEEAQATAAAAATKYAQTITQTPPIISSTAGAIQQASETVQNDRANLAAAGAALKEQKTVTPSDIQRAQVAYTQAQQGANLTVQNAEEQLVQAKATAANSAVSLKRQKELLAQGFVPQSTVDQAAATDAVNQSLITAAQNSLNLAKQSVAAGVPTAKAALLAAQAETQTTAQKAEAVAQARAVLQRDQSALQVAQANIAQDTVQEQNVLQAKSALDQANAAVNYEKFQVGKGLITTPIAGTVIQLATEQGETLNAGLSAPTLIVVADLGRLQVDAYVDETDIGKVKLGQPANVTVDAFPNHTYHGKVVKIASGSTVQEGVVTYDVTISINDRRRQLKPDMTSEVTILTGQLNNVVIVPSVAVNVGVGGSTVSVVSIVDGKKKITQVPVQTGGTDGLNTQIVSGLTSGQTIVLASADTGSSGGHGPQNPFAQKKKSASGAAAGGGGGAGGGPGGGGGGPH
jgi:RND family efflux transporter MFP subunit